MSTTRDFLRLNGRSLAARLAGIAIALVLAAAALHVPRAPAQHALAWTAPHQVSKLQWLALVLQAERPDEFCRAPGCRLRSRFDVLGATAKGTLSIVVEGTNATQLELRAETIDVLEDIRYAGRDMFKMQAPPVRLREVLRVAVKGILKVPSVVDYDCALAPTKFAEATDPEPFRFEQSCSPTK